MGMVLALVFTGYSSFAQTDGPQPITHSNAAQVEPLAIVSESDVIADGATIGVLAGQAGKGGYVPDIAWSPDGTQLAVYSYEGTWLYDTQDYTRLPRLLEGNLIDAQYVPPPVLAYSPDSRMILTASFAPEINRNYGYLWETETGHPKETFRIPMDAVETAVFSPDGAWLALGGCLNGVMQDYYQIDCVIGSAMIWDVATGQLTFSLAAHRESVTSLAFSPDGRLLATGDSQQVRLWELSSAQANAQIQCVWESPVPSDWENTLAFSPDGQQLTMARGPVKIWRLDDCTLDHVLRSDQLGYSNVHLLPDGTIAVSGQFYEGPPLIQQQVIWDGEQIVVSAEPPLEAEHAAISTDGTRIAYSGSSIAIAASPDQTIQALLVKPIEATALSFSPDNRYLAVGGGFAQGQAMIWVWDAQTGEMVQRKTYESAADLGGLHTLRYLSNGDLIGSMALGSDMAIWDSPSLEETDRWLLPEGTAKTIRENQETIGILTYLGRVILRDLSTGEEITPTGIPTGDIIVSMALSPTAPIMAAGTQHTLYIIDTNTGNVLTSHQGHTDWIWQLAFSHDGRWLASASGDFTVRLWDMIGENESSVLATNALPSSELAFSPDDALLAWGNAAEGVEIWDLRAGQRLMTLGEHTGKTGHLAFNPAGDLLATGGQDGIVRLWDLTTGQPLAMLGGHVDAIAALTFSNDGARLATLTANGQAVLWGIPD